MFINIYECKLKVQFLGNVCDLGWFVKQDLEEVTMLFLARYGALSKCCHPRTDNVLLLGIPGENKKKGKKKTQ